MRRALVSLVPVVLAAVLLVGGCGAPDGGARAAVVTNRAQLIGGDRALGDVGDLIIENERIRVVVQKPGFSRGFGVYGGSVIDADLRRPSETGTSGQPTGNDQFGELFPMFFVQAVDVASVFVSADGKDGGPARITAVGEAGDFLELAAILNRAVTGSNLDFQSLTSQPQLRYTITYELEPGRSYLTTRLKVANISSKLLKFPSDFATELLGLINLKTNNFTVPLGDIALFGATSNVFIPGVGFDSRFGLQESYQRKVDFPAFPGLVTEWIASRGAGASYGLAAAPSPRNFVLGKKDIYDDKKIAITDTTLLVPFSASSFLGIYYDSAPAQLAPGQSFETAKHFVIGSGDVGSVLDGINELRGAPTGELGGQVFDTATGVPSAGTQVIVYQRGPDGSHRTYAEYDVREGGAFGGTLVPGSYSLRVTGDARPLGAFVDFDIKAGVTTPVSTVSVPPGRVVVTIVDAEGHPLPAKATAVGTYDAEDTGGVTRRFLFDLQAGERFRPSDLVDDDPSDPATRRYLENTAFTRQGVAELRVRPGTYEIVSSRGPEYDLGSTWVTVGPAETRSVTHKLTRVVDTAGWIAGDLHVHSKNSIDSALSLDERVLALVAEGVEWGVATDHNYVTDYGPYVARNQLLDWLHPMVGLEMTTLESGHFNGYPLRYDPGPVTHGAFAWASREPDALFDDLRALGSLGPSRTIVQVNHGRDGVLGYFSQYQRDAFTGDQLAPTLVQQIIAPKGPAFLTKQGKSTFSTRFDAIEIANGKLFWEMHHFRVPDALPRGALPADVPPAGTILRKANGQPGFPGIIDDWFTLLNQGGRFIAVGTGDSHSGSDEAGQFRTMVYVGDDRPAALTDERLIDALQSRRVLATNGPMLDFYVDDDVSGRMGKTIANPSGHVSLGYRLTAAPWIGVSRLNIWRNGTLAKVISVSPSRNLAELPLTDVVELDLAKDALGGFIDSWFVVEAIGYRSMFPVIKPLEIPPVLLTDAVASLAGPLGLGSDEFGALRPPETFPITAWAMTNPVWVTHGSGPFQPPGPVPIDVQSRPENDPKWQAFVYPRSTIKAAPPRAMKAESRTTDRFEPRGKVPLFYPRADNPFDVRKAMSRFGHLNGHAD
jgi:hypothetical protein